MKEDQFQWNVLIETFNDIKVLLRNFIYSKKRFHEKLIVRIYTLLKSAIAACLQIQYSTFYLELSR